MKSRKPRPERGLTLVTQLSVERFAMLDNQCRHWPHAIAAVLYLPLQMGKVFSAEEPNWYRQPLDVAVAEVGPWAGSSAPLFSEGARDSTVFG